MIAGEISSAFLYLISRAEQIISQPDIPIPLWVFSPLATVEKDDFFLEAFRRFCRQKDHTEQDVYELSVMFLCRGGSYEDIQKEFNPAALEDILTTEISALAAQRILKRLRARGVIG